MHSLPEVSDDSINSRKVKKAFIEATRSLCRLDAILESSLVSDFCVNPVIIQESRYSCMIEHIFTSREDVFRTFYLSESGSDQSVPYVIGYCKAVSEYHNGVIDLEMFEHICSKLKLESMNIRSRMEDCVFLVNGRGDIVGRSPSGETVPRLMGELLEYISNPDVDPLIKAIISHAYFELIHPFDDGNGRTGRILIDRILWEYGLLRKPVLNLSRFLYENVLDYYRVLSGIEMGNSWGSYLFFMLVGIKECADRAICLIKSVSESVKLAYEKACEVNIQKEAVNMIFSFPCFRAKQLVDSGLISKNDVHSVITCFEQIGLITSKNSRKGKIYYNSEIMGLLSE